MTRIRAFAPIILAALSSSACLTAVDDYFKDKKLNRLSVVRDDVSPGRLVLVRDGKAFLGDHILEVQPGTTLTWHSFDAVLPAADRARSLEPAVAFPVLNRVLPLGLNIALTSAVKVSQTNAIGSRIAAADVDALLAANGALAQWVARQAAKGIRPYVITETYKAKSITLESSSGTDVTAEIKTNESKTFDVATGKVKASRTAREKLVLEGDKYYVFAVAVAPFDVGNAKLGDIGVDLSRPLAGRTLATPAPGGPPPFSPVALTPFWE